MTTLEVLRAFTIGPSHSLMLLCPSNVLRCYDNTKWSNPLTVSMDVHEAISDTVERSQDVHKTIPDTVEISQDKQLTFTGTFFYWESQTPSRK